MAEQDRRRQAAPARKSKEEHQASAKSTQRAVREVRMQPKAGRAALDSPLQKAMSELQGLHKLLLSGDLDPHVLADFRDAVNRVRTAAWAAQQYVARKDTDEGPSSVLDFLAGERIRATYQLCQAISDDLKRTDIEFQPGSLVQLHEIVAALTAQLDRVINRRG